MGMVDVCLCVCVCAHVCRVCGMCRREGLIQV